MIGGGRSLCGFVLSHNFASKWAPLSVMTVAGVPNRAIHLLRKASATVSALISTSGMASGQRVKRSTQVSRYLEPSAYARVRLYLYVCGQISLWVRRICRKLAYYGEIF